MLALFPQILFLAPFAATLIRLSMVVILAYAAWQHMSRRDTFLIVWSILEVAAAAALFIGLWVQAVALLAFLASVVSLFVPKMRVFPKSTVYLACVMLLSLVVTGAGAVAFDLPL